MAATRADLAAARALLPHDATPLVVIRPGARWAVECYAEVASRCVRGGALVVLVGPDSALLNEIWRQADQRLSWGAADVVLVLDGLDDSTLRGVVALSDVVVGDIADMPPDAVMDEISEVL